MDIKQIAQKVGTPFYCYSTDKLTRNFEAYRTALADLNGTVCYSVKANPNLSVVAALARLGGGADVVSAGEMYVALKAGIPADKIVFSGVGKTAAELEEAAKAMGVTLNVLYQAAWALIMSRLSPERRALMLTVAASRPVELEHIDQVFGVLIDGVPYNLHCPGDKKVCLWLKELRSLQLESMEHQYTPIQQWIQMGREPGKIPFNSYLIFENHATGEGEKESAAFSLNAAYMNSNLSFPLSMMVFPGASLRVAIIYSSDFFTEEKIQAFTERLREALKALASHPEQTLDEVSALALLDEEHLT